MTESATNPMPNEPSNLGQTGPESVRINGMKVDDLPLGQSNEAVAQMPLVYAAERATKIAVVRAQFPKQSVNYLNSRITECEKSIVNTTNFRRGQADKIAEYKGEVALCVIRDKQLAALDKGAPDYTEKLANIEALFMPYDITAMENQIIQFATAIESADAVIQQEHDSITEFSVVLAKCMERDAALRKLGVYG